MFTNTSTNEICYFMPEDHEVASQALLQQFNDPQLKEVYIKAYAFNWDDLLDKISQKDKEGIKIHILVDYVQSRGPSAWDGIVKLHKNFQNSEILLTTAGANSPSPSQIWHSKAMVFLYKDSTTPKCWEGSVNMSTSGWVQGNTAQLFSSQEWADEFIKHFNVHRGWTLEHAANKQIDYLLKNVVSTESLEYSEENAEYFYQIEVLQKQLKTYKNLLLSSGVLIVIMIFWLIIWSPIWR